LSQRQSLDVHHLSVSFGSGASESRAVKNVSLTLDRGETVALVGESGSGKSVTALSVIQLLPYPLASHPTGSILYRGDELVGAGPSLLRAVRGNEISMIFQEPMTSLNPLHTIEKQIAESLKLHRGLTGAAATERVLELLDLVGVQNARQRLTAYPHELSGGQRQRVMIAMALANEPDLLIADEPTTALDVTIQAQILELLKDLQARLGMALLLITHDLGVVRKMADRICVMTDGEIVERGTPRQIFESPRHPYTRHLLGAEPRPKELRVGPETEVVLDARDIKVWFPVKKDFFGRAKSYVKACDGIDIRVRAGRTVGVVGESGSGKSTLGMALLKLIKSEGEIFFHDQPLHTYSAQQMRDLRQRMQIVFQDPFGSLSPRMSIQQIVEEGLKVHKPKLTDRERIHEVARVIDEVGLDQSSLQRFPHEFSGGQRQRIAIARVLLKDAPILVLDEATSALDSEVEAAIQASLQDLMKGKTVIAIAHRLSTIAAMDRLVVIEEGRIVETGTHDQLINNGQRYASLWSRQSGGFIDISSD